MLMSEIEVYRHRHGPRDGVDIFFLFNDNLWIQLPAHGRTLAVHSLTHSETRTRLEESIAMNGVPSSFLELLIIRGLTRAKVEETFSLIAIVAAGVMK